MPPKKRTAPPGAPDPTPPADPHASLDAWAAKPYWAGCDLEGPKQAYNFGPCTFQARTEKVVDVPGSEIAQRFPQSGLIVRLTDEQVERVQLEARRHVVRSLSGQGAKRGRRLLLTASAHRYLRRRQDYPIGRHLWLIPVSPGFHLPGCGAEGAVPESRMVPESEEWIPPTQELPEEIQLEQQKAKILAAAMRGEG